MGIVIILIILVPWCWCLCVRCLMLARSRRNVATVDSAATCLERVCYGSVAVAVCVLVAGHFYTERLHRIQLVHYLTSSNCSSVGRNGTVWSSVTSIPSRLPAVNMDDPAVRRGKHLVANKHALLQSPVDVPFSVLPRRNINVLPTSRRRHVPSSSTATKP